MFVTHFDGDGFQVTQAFHDRLQERANRGDHYGQRAVTGVAERAQHGQALTHCVRPGRKAFMWEGFPAGEERNR